MDYLWCCEIAREIHADARREIKRNGRVQEAPAGSRGRSVNPVPALVHVVRQLVKREKQVAPVGILGSPSQSGRTDV